MCVDYDFSNAKLATLSYTTLPRMYLERLLDHQEKYALSICTSVHTYSLG